MLQMIKTILEDQLYFLELVYTNISIKQHNGVNPLQQDYIIIFCMSKHNTLSLIPDQDAQPGNSSEVFSITSMSSKPQRFQKIRVEFKGITDENQTFKVIQPTINKGQAKGLLGFTLGYGHVRDDSSLVKDLDDGKGQQQPCILIPQVQENRSKEILVAKPKNSTCYLCKMVFQDYSNHIETNTHKENTEKCKVTREIRELTRAINASRRPTIFDLHREADMLNQKPIKKRSTQQTLGLGHDGCSNKKKQFQFSSLT